MTDPTGDALRAAEWSGNLYFGVPLRSKEPKDQISEHQARECQAILDVLWAHIREKHKDTIAQMETELVSFGYVLPETYDNLRRELEAD